MPDTNSRAQDIAWVKSSPVPDQVSGTVKWFDTVRGYGMIASDDGGGDVFVHLSCLRRAGHTEIPEGARIVCKAVSGPKGRQAISIVRLDIPATRELPQAPSSERALFAGVPARGDFEGAEVKWFNRTCGYGFLTQGDMLPDIFIPLRVLRLAGEADLYPGQRVMVRVAETEKGLLATEIIARADVYARRGVFAPKTGAAVLRHRPESMRKPGNEPEQGQD